MSIASPQKTHVNLANVTCLRELALKFDFSILKHYYVVVCMVWKIVLKCHSIDKTH
jgi:hypothetical protein